jgi:hypothetical protein
MSFFESGCWVGGHPSLIHLGLAALLLAWQWRLSIYHFGVFNIFISFLFKNHFCDIALRASPKGARVLVG